MFDLFFQDLLLSVATSLAEYFKLQPTYIVAFPVFKVADDLELSVHSLSSDILTASWHQVPPWPSKQQVNGLSGGLTANATAQTNGVVDVLVKGATSRSALSSAPVQVTLKDNVMWPAFDCSFSLSLWLRIEGTSEEAGLCVRRTRRAGKGNHFKHSSSYEHNNSQSKLALVQLLTFTLSNFIILTSVSNLM